MYSYKKIIIGGEKIKLFQNYTRINNIHRNYAKSDLKVIINLYSMHINAKPDAHQPQQTDQQTKYPSYAKG